MTLLSLATVTVNGAADGTLPQAAGLYDIETSIAGQRPARFTLSLPSTIGDDTRHALVVVLHYAGQPTRFYGRPLVEELFEPAWRALDAVFVAPESIDGQWNSATNEAYVLGLIDSLSAHYRIDPKRVVVAGYSMGAIGSWHFITHYPERFSAAVPVAGFPRAEVGCEVPVYALATESDEIFDYVRLRSGLEALRERGCVIEFASVDARGHYDVNGFSSALGAVAPWLRSVWLSPDHSGD